MLDFDVVAQIGIGVFGLTAILLANLNSKTLTKFAPILGLCSQPFWFYTTYFHQQWGVFVMAFVYTILWCIGIYNYWFRNGYNRKT